MRTFRRVLSSINYLFPKLLTLDPSGAAAATMLVHGLLILAELLNWYVFYIPDWVFGAQMKVRTFALVIDWKKIDSRSGVQLGDNSQSSLGRKDPALFFFPRFLAKVTPAEHCHIFGLVVAFFWHGKSLFENLSFIFPDMFVAELEIVVLWMLSFLLFASPWSLHLHLLFSRRPCCVGHLWKNKLKFPKCSPPSLDPRAGRKGLWKNITVSAPNLKMYPIRWLSKDVFPLCWTSLVQWVK